MNVTFITDTANHTGVKFRAVVPLVETVFNTATMPSATGSLDGETVDSGVPIETTFTQIQLTSGALVCYDY